MRLLFYVEVVIKYYQLKLTIFIILYNYLQYKNDLLKIYNDIHDLNIYYKNVLKKYLNKKFAEFIRKRDCAKVGIYQSS